MSKVLSFCHLTHVLPTFSFCRFTHRPFLIKVEELTEESTSRVEIEDTNNTPTMTPPQNKRANIAKTYERSAKKNAQISLLLPRVPPKQSKITPPEKTTSNTKLKQKSEQISETTTPTRKLVVVASRLTTDELSSKLKVPPAVKELLGDGDTSEKCKNVKRQKWNVNT